MMMSASVFAMAAPADGAGSWVQFVPFVLVIGIFYFVILMPMQRKQKKVQEFQQALKPGDRVITTGGIHGEITRVSDDAVQLQIAEGWHIQANPAGDPDDPATEVEIDESKLEIKLTSLRYPKGKSTPRAPGEPPQLLYEGKVSIFGQLEIPASAAGQDEDLVVSVMHQACDDKQCLPPKPLKLKIPVKIARPGEQSKPINEALFAAPAKKK